MQRSRFPLPLALLLASMVSVSTTGCGNGKADDTTGPSVDGEPATTVGVTPDPRPAGPALWIEGELVGDRAGLALRAANLGEVLGLSFHLRHDERELLVERAEMLQPLGPDAPGEAIYLARTRPGDVALGGTRRGIAAGASRIDEPTTIAEIEARVPGGESTRLEIVDLVVRRLDGGFVGTAVAGVSLAPDTTSEGGAR